MARIDFDIMMLKICDIISQRSTCIKGRVGCVIVREGRIISMGYNGMPPGFKNCAVVDDCPRWDIPSGTKYEVGDCSHAEHNAVVYCAVNGVSTRDATMYVNSSVCRMCAKTIIMAQIKKVVYLESDYDGIELLREAADIYLVRYSKEDVYGPAKADL